MTEHDSRWMYRQTIDAMVVACLQGQGQVSAERIRVGVWNPNADAETDPNQVTMNDVLRIGASRTRSSDWRGTKQTSSSPAA